MRSGRGVLERGVEAAPVVPALDEAEDLGACGASGGPDVAIGQFFLECVKEALGDGIVPAGARPSHTLPETAFSEYFGICGAGVLSGFKGSSQHRSQELRCSNANVGAQGGHYEP